MGRWGAPKDTEKLLRGLVKKGWMVTLSGASHLRVTGPGGSFTVSLTPKNPSSQLRKVKADVRRVGGEV